MKYQSNKIADIRKHIREELQSYYPLQEADALVSILIEEFTGVSRIKLATDPDLRISESEILRIYFAVKDLKKYRPIQYITGKTDFYGMTFKVDERVLIPRPETEEMVRMIVKIEGEKGRRRALDVGTGSGIIAIALAKQLTNLEVIAVDKSPEALSLAQENAEQLGARVVFKESDFLDQAAWPGLGSFDLIVSNPPYIPDSEKPSLSANVVNYEPHQALFIPDEEWLKFYEAIFRFSTGHLNEGGAIYAEIHERSGEALKKLACEYGNDSVRIIKDLSGRERFLVC